MPLYKLAGNRLLTVAQNALLGSQLSEFHSGYRIYDVRALASIPFELNTNDFHFDTEIIIQMMLAERRILELPIPTYYGEEICYVNGVKYARDVLLSTLKARVQALDLVYDPKFDCRRRKRQPRITGRSSDTRAHTRWHWLRSPPTHEFSTSAAVTAGWQTL